MEYPQRIDNLQQLLAEHDLAAFWVTSREDCLYLLGFAGHTDLDVSLLLTKQAIVIIASHLYESALKDRDLPFILIEPDLGSTLQRVVSDMKIPSLGLDGSALSAKAWREVGTRLDGTQLEEAGPLVSELRLIKDEEEQNLIRRACELTDRAYSNTISLLEPGMSEKKVAWILERELREAGCDDLSFRPLIVAAGLHSAEPHHFPGDYELRAGDVIQFDLGGRVDGYGADLSRVAVLGSPSPKQLSVYEALRQAQDKALELAAERTEIRQIDRECKKVIEDLGYPVYRHGLGHGIGLAPNVHEEPVLGDRDKLLYSSLESGMVYTIEPGIYLEGRFGMRLEDVALQTDDGIEILSRADRLLKIIN